MAKWTAFPYAGDYTFDVASVKKLWDRLHAGDAEPLPTPDGHSKCPTYGQSNCSTPTTVN